MARGVRGNVAPMLVSELLRFRVLSNTGEVFRLVDIGVDLSAGDYPPLNCLVLRTRADEVIAHPWAGTSIQAKAKHIVINSTVSPATASGHSLERLVLLGRDIMDALVLDLDSRTAIRANDLWVADVGGWRLRGADVSPWAVLRRLGRGWLGHGGEARLLDWRCAEFLRGDPAAARAGHDYHRRVAQLPPAEIANLLNSVPYLHAAELLTLLPDPLAADTLEAMNGARQLQVFEELDADQACRLLALVAPDVAADILGLLDPERTREVLEALPPLQAERVLALLEYPPDSAGGIMTNDIVVASATMTVGEARVELADQLRTPDFVYYVFAVDGPETRHLRGVVTLRDLLVGEDSERLEDIMTQRTEHILPLAPAGEAARRMAENDFAALPVVDTRGRLLGAVTVDAAFEQLLPAGLRDLTVRIFS